MAASMHRVLLGVFVLCTVSLCWFLYALHSVGVKHKMLQQATTMPQNAFFQLIASGSGGSAKGPSSMEMIESDATAWLSSHQLLLIPANGRNNSYVVRSAAAGVAGPTATNWLPPIAVDSNSGNGDASVLEFAAAAASSNGKRNERAQFVQVYSQHHHRQRATNTNTADYYEQNTQQQQVVPPSPKSLEQQRWTFEYSKNRNPDDHRVSSDAVDLYSKSSIKSSSLDAVSDKSTTTARVCGRKGPAQHIVFAKTHKCGSSTVQSILLRYADEHNFHIAFPKPRYFNYYVPFPKRFRAEAIYDWGVDQNSVTGQRPTTLTTTIAVGSATTVPTEEMEADVTSKSLVDKIARRSLNKQRIKRSFLPPQPVGRSRFSTKSTSSAAAPVTPATTPYRPNYNLMCFHSRFDYGEARRAMPQPDTLFVTIVRDPVAQFESIYTFYRLGRVFANATFEEFIMQPETYTDAYPDNYVYRSRNPMMFDFGLDPHLMDNGSAVMEKILEIERQFDLVLIADLMDESLVLLRDLLCWDWRDMVAFRKNTRMDRYRLRALNRPTTPAAETLAPSTSVSTDPVRQNRAAGSTSPAAASENIGLLPPIVQTNTEKQLELDNDRKHAQKISDAVRRWNWADQMLYDHFSAKLRAQLAAKQQESQAMSTPSSTITTNGQNSQPTPAQQQPVVPDEQIQNGIERLRRDRQSWMSACVSSELAPLQVERMFREYGGLSSSFQLRDSAYANRTCVQLALPELQYIKQLFAKQHPILPEDGVGT